MHINWLTVGLTAGPVFWYAFATFVAYMPDPKDGDLRWWYAPLWQTLQYIAANRAKVDVIKGKRPNEPSPLSPPSLDRVMPPNPPKP